MPQIKHIAIATNADAELSANSPHQELLPAPGMGGEPLANMIRLG